MRHARAVFAGTGRTAAHAGWVIGVTDARPGRCAEAEVAAYGHPDEGSNELAEQEPGPAQEASA
ncbi:MAG: hypothetical protein R6W77_16295 [Trueperaceae bacterium]